MCILPPWPPPLRTVHHRLHARRRRLRLVHGVRNLDQQLKGGGACRLVALLDAQDDFRHH
jgi:hypothetical protein